MSALTCCLWDKSCRHFGEISLKKNFSCWGSKKIEAISETFKGRMQCSLSRLQSWKINNLNKVLDYIIGKFWLKVMASPHRTSSLDWPKLTLPLTSKNITYCITFRSVPTFFIWFSLIQIQNHLVLPRNVFLFYLKQTSPTWEGIL